MTQKCSGKKRIISFDLDMTLLNHKNWKIPDSALEALELLRRDSVIVIASGRNMDHEMSSMYKELINPDAIIHMNGTRVVAESEVLYEHFMDKERLRALLTFAENRVISLGLSVNGGDYYLNPDQVRAFDVIRWGESQRSFKDAWKLIEMPVRTLVYIGGPKQAKMLQEQFPDFKFPMFSDKMGADIVEKECSKAKGLLRLCQYYRIDRKETIAFGDSMNDYEMLQEAGLGIAMGNATDNLKTVADYVTDNIDEDGVWKACRYFHLI